jgi:hypothetical protein
MGSLVVGEDTHTISTVLASALTTPGYLEFDGRMLP